MPFLLPAVILLQVRSRAVAVLMIVVVVLDLCRVVVIQIYKLTFNCYGVYGVCGVIGIDAAPDARRQGQG